MKALRILGLVFGLVLVLVAVALGTLYALFDGEKIKAELARVVMEQKQRKLDIAGKVELSVWPDVGIKLGRLTLSEPGGKEEFLALDSARVEVAVMPLLSKQVKVQRIEVNGLKATLVKHKDGTLNIADLTGGAGGGADKPASSKTAPKVGAGDTATEPVLIDIAGIRIANAQLTWRDEKSKETTTLSNLDFGSGRVQADSGRQTLAVDALSLAARGKTGADSFELKLDVPRLNIAPDKSTGETLNLTASLAGNGRNLVAKLVLSGVEGDLKALKIGKLVLDLDAKAGESTLKAHLDSPVAADITAQTVALEKLAGSIDLTNPQMPMKQLKLPLAGSLRADLAKQSAALDLGTRFDESKIALKLKVAKFAPLALGFDLDIDTLNVDKYLPPKKAEEKVAAAPGTGKTAPEGKEAAGGKEGKLDFSALKGHDVNGTLRIGSLQVSKLKLAKLNAKIRLAGGRLDVAPLTLDLYEGSASGSLSLNAAGNQLGLKQNLTGISINPLMKDLADKDLLEGRGNVALDVSSQGDSVPAMKKALAGTASLSLKDGAIKGINLAQSMRDIKGKLGALQGKPEGATQKAKAGDKTDFSELTASLKIANGVAHNDDLMMKSPFLRLTGAGDIDIGAGQMNYLAKATAVSSSAGQGGKDADKLKGVTVPVRVTGPFEALSYKLELGDLAADMAKAKLEGKMEGLTGKSDEKTKNKLKGLFGR